MRVRSGISEASLGDVAQGRWCFLRIGASHTAVVVGADVSLFTLEAWKCWIAAATFAAEPRKDLLYRPRDCGSSR